VYVLHKRQKDIDQNFQLFSNFVKSVIRAFGGRFVKKYSFQNFEAFEAFFQKQKVEDCS